MNPPSETNSLAEARKGDRGLVVQVGGEAYAGAGGVDAAEIERRLLEIGFVEGARFEILHEGLFGRDPIGVRLDDLTVALRRREAAQVRVRFVHEAAVAAAEAPAPLPDEAAA
ncbi:MAG: ferrous iron transport protein A [Proteobacteria bacterium]|nr:ferrous iron transport protein A [Pseudomonadota bacterium]